MQILILLWLSELIYITVIEIGREQARKTWQKKKITIEYSVRECSQLLNEIFMCEVNWFKEQNSVNVLLESECVVPSTYAYPERCI